MLTSDQISQEIYDWLEGLPKKVILNLLLHALDDMQACNNRTMQACILDTLSTACHQVNDEIVIDRKRVIERFS